VTAVKARKTKEMRCMVSFVGVGRGVSVLIAAKRTNDFIFLKKNDNLQTKGFLHSRLIFYIKKPLRF